MTLDVKYSYFRGKPSLIIKGSDFLKYIDTEDEVLLDVAINGFGKSRGVDAHFNDEVIEVLKNKLTKNSNYVLTYGEKWIGSQCILGWCEVYIQNGIENIDIVLSDDGISFSLNKE